MLNEGKEMAASDIHDVVARTKKSALFLDLNHRFEAQEVRTWSTLDERALLYSFAALDHVKTVVEVGAFCGGSTSFLAGPMQQRGLSRVVFSVDPFIGAPVWFPRGWMHSTFDEFVKNIDALGLSEQVVPLIGESAAMASVWPARELDLLFIDGDHSFIGVISDFEKWAPKVSIGGYILLDDVDDIAEVGRFNTLVSRFQACQECTFSAA